MIDRGRGTERAPIGLILAFTWDVLIEQAIQFQCQRHTDLFEVRASKQLFCFRVKPGVEVFGQTVLVRTRPQFGSEACELDKVARFELGTEGPPPFLDSIAEPFE